jgi:NTE family protein
MSSKPHPICLALQGGGSHGAFEWGVLDALLEDGRVYPVAASGASAGAMNATVLASGLIKGGAVGGRVALEAFWRRISDASPHNPFGDFSAWTGPAANAGSVMDAILSNPFLKAAQSMTQSVTESLMTGQSALSPYQFNPFNFNPLRDALEASVDFAALRKASPLKLFISATEVRSGRSRVFTEAGLTCDHVLASACLPYLFQAVMIEGQPYWDGGFLSNPPLWPLFYGELPRDVLVVGLNPFERAEDPRNAGEIMDRLNEISFNATLISEMRAVAFVDRLVEDDLLNEKGKARYKPVRMHMIRADGVLDDLPMSTKFQTDWSFLCDLKARGRKAATDWLSAHLGEVGRRSSVDVRKEFL